MTTVDLEPTEAPTKASGSSWRTAAWWRERLVGTCWIGLGFLWLFVATWALRLGEPLLITWVITAVLPMLLVAAWPVVVIAGLLRRRALLAAALATLLLQVVVAWPMFSHLAKDTHQGRYRVASLNLFVDNDDLGHTARDLRAVRADILLVQEFTPQAQAAFRQAGLSSGFRHRIEHHNQCRADQQRIRSG